MSYALLNSKLAYPFRLNNDMIVASDFLTKLVQGSDGDTVGETGRKIGVTEQTYYRWRREYGGIRVEQARRLKELEKDSTRLKKLVAVPSWAMPF